MKLTCIFSFLIFLSFIGVALGREPDNTSEMQEQELPSTGNFILPDSQQPGPFISFGQNIIDQNETQVFLFADDSNGSDQYTIDIIPSVLYGVTDDFSVFFNMPIAGTFKNKQNHSAGLEDAFLQLEYAFYSKSTSSYTEGATIVTNTTFPTGSSSKQPPTGFDSPSFFWGATFNRTYIKWILFTSSGAVFITNNNNTEFGNQLLYQAGLGRDLFNIDSKWIIAGIVEADGSYIGKNQINGIIDNNSGGNSIYMTPSLWISSKKLILQFGVELPVVQHLYGDQEKNNYALALNLGWTL